jgi:hypothetical protein
VLSWSQLDFEARVMLIDRGGVEAVTAPLDAATIQNALDLAIAQRAATAEADKLNAYPVERRSSTSGCAPSSPVSRAPPPSSPS